jgi:SAM-dependent methyltransferase
MRNILMNLRSIKYLNKCIELYKRFNNLYWEMKFGISTRGMSDNLSSDPSNFYYSTISYKSIFKIINYINFKSSDEFVDIGCGKGRVLCCAASFNIKKVVGIELDKTLSEVAKLNAMKLKNKKSTIEIQNISAQDYDYSDGTIFFFFNPFNDSVLKKVFTRIHKSLLANNREITVIYVNPQFEKVIESFSWLSLVNRWKVEDISDIEHNISFWRSKDSK